MKPVPAASPALTARPWQLAHPLWQCGFRPFFVATVLFCVGLLGLWLLFLAAGWPLPGVPGGAPAANAEDHVGASKAFGCQAL